MRVFIWPASCSSLGLGVCCHVCVWVYMSIYMTVCVTVFVCVAFWMCVPVFLDSVCNSVFVSLFLFVFPSENASLGVTVCLWVWIFSSAIDESISLHVCAEFRSVWVCDLMFECEAFCVTLFWYGYVCVFPRLSVYDWLCVSLCVCMCVGERERERKRERIFEDTKKRRGN